MWKDRSVDAMVLGLKYILTITFKVKCSHVILHVDRDFLDRMFIDMNNLIFIIDTSWFAMKTTAYEIQIMHQFRRKAVVSFAFCQ